MNVKLIKFELKNNRLVVEIFFSIILHKSAYLWFSVIECSLMGLAANIKRVSVNLGLATHNRR